MAAERDHPPPERRVQGREKVVGVARLPGEYGWLLPATWYNITDVVLLLCCAQGKMVRARLTGMVTLLCCAVVVCCVPGEMLL